ncbi:MAG: hypothetical protein AAF215_10650 [Cyanobacteria bacterium P01_A01_bin.123]
MKDAEMLGYATDELRSHSHGMATFSAYEIGHVDRRYARQAKMSTG